MTTRTLTTLAVIGATVLTATSSAERRWQVVGITGPGVTDSVPMAINDSGWIVGNYVTTGTKRRPFLYMSGNLTQLPMAADAVDGYAYDLNEAGQVVGADVILTPTNFHRFKAWRYSFGTGKEALSSFSGGIGDESRAHAIDGVGNVYGAASGRNGTSPLQAAMWTGPGFPTWLSTLGQNTLITSSISDVNETGTMAGWSEMTTNVYRGVTRTLASSWAAAPLPAGVMHTDLTGINDAGDVAGYGVFFGGRQIATRRKAGGALDVLPSLPGAGANDSSRTLGITEAGEALGWCEVNGVRKGTLWTAAGAVDIGGQLVSSPGWTVRELRQMNAHGEMIGHGTLNGQTRGVLLKPIQRITGQVQLQDFLGNMAARPVAVQFRDPDNGQVFTTINTALNAQGRFIVDTQIRGEWVIAVRVSGWLSATADIELGSHDEVVASFSLRNGDITWDNRVDIDDFLVLGAHYEQSPLANVRADLNGDGACNVDDFLILAANYEQEGQ